MKGYSIDCNYLVKVSELLQEDEVEQSKSCRLPRPHKKTFFIRRDGEILPLIRV